jgi:hypothetical protein
LAERQYKWMLTAFPFVVMLTHKFIQLEGHYFKID